MKKLREIKKYLTQKFELAPEAVGCTRLIIIDNTHIYLENYQSVLEYTQKRVGIHIGTHNLIIEGTGLVLESLGKENMAVSGKIASIQYENIT